MVVVNDFRQGLGIGFIAHAPIDDPTDAGKGDPWAGFRHFCDAQVERFCQ